MFIRTHRIRRYVYTEVMQSYRDPGNGRLLHRCIVRWPAHRSLTDEISRTQWNIEEASRNVAFWQGLLDRTVQPRFPEQVSRAPEFVKFWRRRLAKATAHLAALGEVRAGSAANHG
jgi:hypothetical protein